MVEHSIPSALAAFALAGISLVFCVSAANASTRVETTDGARNTEVSPNSIAKHEEDPRRLVIFFHGIRGRGSIMDAIGTSWRKTLPDTDFVSPDAPFAHRSGGREWFKVDDQVLRPDRIAAARKAFDELVTDIVKREGFDGDLKNVAFVGVSQGAIMALDAVSSGRWKVGALVSFAGLLPLPPTSSSKETSILLLHGGADTRIPSAASVAAEAQLKGAGYDVTYKLFPSVGHTISSEQAEQAASFLKQRWAYETPANQRNRTCVERVSQP